MPRRCSGPPARPCSNAHPSRRVQAQGVLLMCNLYTLDKSDAELRDIFDIRADDGPRFNTPEEMLPGYPGLVMREEEGKRILEQMVWGFPLRLKSMKPDAKPKPVNNIADLRKPMWIGLA